MKYFMRMVSVLLCIVLVLSGTGCGDNAVPESSVGTEQQDAENVPEQNKYANVVSMEETPIVNYTLPPNNPNIIVSLHGYGVGETKEAIVKGKNLPKIFQVLDLADGEVMYTGYVQDVSYDEKQGIYFGYADFSDVETVGEYYISCDIVGHSQAFEIHENLYQTLLAEVYKKVIEGCESKNLTIVEALMVLQTYEWYPQVFPDGDSDKKQDILVALQGWVSHMEENGVEKGDEALYATFLAKFSYLYQKLDYKYATDCLQRASTVFGQVQETQAKDADVFYALTELYRATAHYKYRNRIVGYDSYFDANSSYPQQREYIYGGLTYLVTRHAVDKGLCERFINQVLARGDEISQGYVELIHPVAAKNNGTEEVIKRALELSCANYVLNNYQYTNIIKEFLHYLMGRNLESADYYEAGENMTDYLMLLAQLVATEAALKGEE